MNRLSTHRIHELVSEAFRVDLSKVRPETRFIEDLSANSLDVVELIALLEGECEVSINDEGIANVRTVGDLVRLVDNASIR